ncbi:MAG: hypothetical protein ACHRXM_21990 [Isosphaerales bacterium]
MRVRLAAALLLVLLVSSLAVLYLAKPRLGGIPWPGILSSPAETYEVEVTDYQPPQPKPEEEVVDDQLSEKNPTFIPDLIDRRPEGTWRINASSAVLRLDAPMLKPDADAALLELRPSYADAVAKAPAGMKVLPSINVIDGKAKQFDDGLFAAIDLAYYNGLKSRLESHVALIERLHERVAPESLASAYLAAGLKIAGVEVKTGQPDQAASWLSRFESDAMYSKPLSFYTWSEELTRVFRFMRFFQQPLSPDKPGLISDLAKAVGSDPKLLEDYKRVNAFYARLTNPLDNLTLADVHERGGKFGGPQAIAVFPSSRSKETDLFRQLFPEGLPPSADLMTELIQAIRKGKVDLAPKPSSGWYEYQIYALETFLLPQKGQENPKLLLTKAYKKRMLEAFQALITKRRETHARDAKSVAPTSMAPPPPAAKVKPRLRVEPCPSYHLRTARSYDFLLNFLLAAVGEDGLASLHGLKEGGERSKTLLEELRWMRELFYGLHLLSAEDVGMAPGLRPDEPVDRAACEAKATKWLASCGNDVDLRVDTRVAVPLYFDIPRRRTRLWATIGVRLAKLDVSFAKPPKIKPTEGTGGWEEVKPYQLGSAAYVIAVDEFAEVEIPGLQPLTRKEFRDACNAHKTKPEILQALSRRSP